MKIFIFALLLSVTAYSQTVSKVNGAQVQISGAEVSDLKIGEEVQFLNEELDKVGTGTITKISPNGKAALVKVKSGQVAVGQTVESNRESGAEKKSLARPSQGDAYSSLSESEREILSRGPISTERYVIGGILGTYPIGFGLGHAVQGRYLEKGWIFTVGELASLSVAMAGIGDCLTDSRTYNRGCSGGLLGLGLAGFVGFRIWEIVDVWAAPLEHNRRYEQIKHRLGERSYSFKPVIVPTSNGGILLGMNMTF